MCKYIATKAKLLCHQLDTTRTGKSVKFARFVSENFTFRFYDERVVLIHESFFQTWSVRFTFARIAMVFNVNCKG